METIGRKFKVGTPVLYIPGDGKFINLNSENTCIGMIVEINEEYEDYPYRIAFADGDDDWFNDENRFITRITNAYQTLLGVINEHGQVLDAV